jgi:hypothetical protein
MKKVSLLFFVFGIIFSNTINSQSKLKRYHVKSGIVTYQISTSGKVMGSTISGGGTENVYFKDWGAIELKEETTSQTTSMKFFGKEKIEKSNTHTMSKLHNSKSYHVDFDKKSITETTNAAMNVMQQTNSDASKTGESMLEAMGGKKVGNETFMGYSCDVWEIPGGKQWLHKGVLLKLDMTILGIKTLKVANSAKFDISVAESNFKLPNFPITKQESYMTNEVSQNDMDDMDENMDKIQNLSFEQWKKIAVENDEEMKQMSDEELLQTYNMIQKMIKMRKGN